jgi:hypothetical protein
MDSWTKPTVPAHEVYGTALNLSQSKHDLRLGLQIMKGYVSNLIVAVEIKMDNFERLTGWQWQRASFAAVTSSSLLELGG